MSKRITEITIEQTDEYKIVYTPADKDYALIVSGLGIMGYYSSATEARAMADAYRYENACAGWGCVDGCGDCQADMDFSQDEPTINAQLAAKGMRLAHGERGAFVNVTEHGRITQVWGCPIEQPHTASMVQFFSYADAKMR